MDITAFSEGRTWAIVPEALETMMQRLQAFGDLKALEQAAARFVEEPEERDDFLLRNGVAVIPVHGPIFKRGSIWSFLFGGTPLSVLTSVLMDALADRDVQAVVLDIDSPGGTVSGTEAFGDLVYRARDQKPVVSFGNGMIASAAYWIGSGAHRVVVESTADVGSIGVLMTHYDWSREDEMMGLKRTFLTAGKYKALGNDAEPLSDLARKTFQAELDYVYSIFIETVARNRGVAAETVAGDMADGRIFIGQQAVDAGLSDEVGGLDTAIEAAQELVEAAGPKPFNVNWGASASAKEKEYAMSKQETAAPAIETVEQLAAAFPGLAEQLRQQGRESVDLEGARSAAVSDESARILGLAAVMFGEEQGDKFKALVASGITVDQYQAVRGAGDTSGEEPESPEAAAVANAKQDMLAAINAAGPENPGAGAGSDAPASFEEAWKAVKAEENCSVQEAMKRVAARHPELHTQYLEDLKPAGSA